MANEVFSSRNFDIYQGLMDRNLLQVKLAASERMNAQLKKLEQKYDGKAAQRVLDDASKVADEKARVSDWLSRVDDGLDVMNDVRIWMLEMKAAIAAGNGPAYDNSFDALNADMDREGYKGNSLVHNTGNDRGTWRKTTELVSSGGITASVTNNYLGNDYIIQLGDGTNLISSSDGKKLGDAKGTVSLNVSDLALVSYTDGEAVFEDRSDPDNPVQYTGTVKRGGLGVLPAWLYGNFATADDKARAQTDMAAAFKALANVERTYNLNQAQLSGMNVTLGGKLDQLRADYDRVANAELDAKQAERRAIKSRFELQNNALALTSGRAQNFIWYMFNQKPPEKQTLTDIMLNQVR